MAWTRNDFEKAALEIGKQFVSSGGKTSINDLSTKVASDNKLNIEGIRTVVRLANVSAFEQLFAKSAADKASDRMLEFEVGDPEIVVNRLHKDAQEKHEVKTASTYNRTLDLYGDVVRDREPLEKTASAVPGYTSSTAQEQKPVSRQAVQLQFKLASDRIREQGLQAKVRWSNTMENAIQSVRVCADTPAKIATFEKNAVALFGEDVIPELYAINTAIYSKRPGYGVATLTQYAGQEKVASIADGHIATVRKFDMLMQLVKEASDARKQYQLCKKSEQWVSDNMPKVK